MYNLFSTPIRQRKVREGVTAYRYRNGTINIEGEKYIGYSMTDAIKLWRRKHSVKTNTNV